MKWLAIPLLAVFLMIGVTPAVAVDSPLDGKALVDQRFAAQKAAVEKAKEEGKITEAQAERRLANIEARYKAIVANNYQCPAEGPVKSRIGRGQGNAGWGKSVQGQKNGATRRMGPASGICNGQGCGLGLGSCLGVAAQSK